MKHILFIFMVSSLFLLTEAKSTDYARHLELSLLFYEAQRSGPLPDNNRIYWRHDSMLDAGSDVGVDLTGGYYDAGDNCKFNFPGAGALTLIAWSAIEFKEGYEKAGQYDYVLDMVKWGADYFVKCHAEKDTLYIQVGDGSLDHSYWCPPEYITYKYPAYKVDKEHPGTEVAGETAASLAATSILFKEIDSAYSETLLQHAIELYDFADKYRGDYTSSVPEVGRFYGTNKNGIYDELEWGALWLYRATGDTEYLEKFETLIASDKGYSSCNRPISWDEKYPGVYILSAQILEDEKYMTKAYKYCDAIVDCPKTPGGLCFFQGLSRWGSNRHASNAAAMVSFFVNILPKDDEKRETYLDFVQSQINYILGDNPLGINFVVGAEENSPQSVHHRAASYTTETNALPSKNIYTLWGALAGGPGENDDYEDDRNDYEKNEVAIDYNAGFTCDLAALVQFGLGEKDDEEVLNFDRAWPKKIEKPIVNIKFTKSAITVTTENGLMCGSFCVSFYTNTTVDKVGASATGINLEGPKITICNGLENGFLDGRGGKQSLKFRLTDTVFEEPEEFEFLCDGFRLGNARKKEQPVYNPEYGHLFRIIGTGGEEGTEPLYEGSCWPSFVC